MTNDFLSIAQQAASDTVQANAEAVARWLEDQPGAWGELAGKAVLAARDAKGGTLTTMERRVVWQVLWDRLSLLRRAR